MKLFLALVLAVCLGVALAGPGMGSSSMYGQDTTTNQVYRDPSTGRSYTQDQVHQALEAMYGMGAYNNQMYDSRMSQPYQYNSNANRG